VLTLASQLYALGARARRAAARARPGTRRRLDRPVVSIGNLSVGGTGKTPLVALVAGLLQEAGERPAILSRGYARTEPDDGVTVVSDGQRILADLPRAGDEPLMLARTLPRVPVLVSPDRYLAGRVAELHLGATVHLLDDGFQHFQLARAVDLLVVDPADIDRPRTLPSGRLREPVGAARHADALLIADPAADLAALADRLGVPDVFRLLRESAPAMEETAAAGPTPLPPGSRVVVVSGIARPERFEAEAREAGCEVVAAVTFGDHHPFTRADVGRLAETVAAHPDSVVLTTEKDLMRLLPLRPWPFRVAVRPMHVRVEPDGFGPWLLARIAAWREAGA
jgi:tetraacyldisaccharide 4'-kinase